MKILVVSTVYPPNALGGAEITAHMLARCFTASGHEVVSASLAPDGIARTLMRDGIRCHYLPLANLYWPFGKRRPWDGRRVLWHLIDSFNVVMGRRLGRIMDLERPDVVHMHNLQGFSVSAWWAARRRGLPVVQTLHDYYLACPRSTMFRRGRNCDGRCVGCCAVRGPRLALSTIPYAVTAVSQRLLDRITATGVLAGVPRRVVIRNGNEPGWRAAGAERRPGAAPGRGDGTALRVGYLGRLQPLKGLETLLQASKLLPSAAFTVAIAGTGPPGYVETLRAGTDGGNVRFVGFVNPAEFFGEIDILVVPSVWEEPAGRVIHEAYAYGVPVVASRLGGPIEMIAEGRTGYLFEPGNPQALADVLVRARDDGAGAGAMAQACREESAKYDVETIAGEYLDLLAAAAAAARAGRPDQRPASERRWLSHGGRLDRESRTPLRPDPADADKAGHIHT